MLAADTDEHVRFARDPSSREILSTLEDVVADDAGLAGVTEQTRVGLNYMGARVLPVLCGFVAGAIFWHLVGFWSFISEMVFHGPREKTVIAAPVSSRATASNVRLFSPMGQHATSGIPQLGGCTTLHQEAPGGTITKVPCGVNSPMHLETAKETVSSSASRGADFSNASNIETGSVSKLSTDENNIAHELNSGWSTSLDVAP